MTDAEDDPAGNDVDSPEPSQEDPSPPPDVGSTAAVPAEEATVPPVSVETFMAGMMQWGPTQNPVAKKVTSEHISAVLETQKLNITEGFKDLERDRSHAKFTIVVTGVFILALIGLLLWTGNEAMVREVLTYIGIGGGLGIGGYGLAKGRE